MKDSRTRLPYKAENVVDLDANLTITAEIYNGNEIDSATLEETAHAANTNLNKIGSNPKIQEVAAEKGYHAPARKTRTAQQTC